MSISGQRNSLRKSSTSINRIQKSISGLREGLLSIRKNASNILQEQRKTNLFKRNVIRKDSEFFNKRRENVLRKQREDELESSSVTGVAKKQGNLFAQSTRGFFGRILDFLGVLLVGWALQNLPKFIAAFQKLFGMIKKVVEIMTGFVKVITTFLKGIGAGLGKLFNVISKIDFSAGVQKAGDLFQQGSQALFLLGKEFVEGVNAISSDEDIRNAGLSGFVDQNNTQDNNRDNTDDTENENQDGFFQGIKNLFGLGKKDDDEDKGGEEIEGRANGGSFEKGQEILVGEEGAEIVRFNQGGEVIDNENTMNLIEGQQTLPDDEVLETDDDERIIGEIEEKIARLNDKDKTDKKLISPMDEKKDNFNITMPSTGGVESEDDTKVKSKDETKVEGKNNMVENIIPPRRQLKNLKGKKKPTTRTFIIEKPSMDMGSGGLQPMVNSGDSIKISQKSQSDISTLLRLQSGSTLKYT